MNNKHGLLIICVTIIVCICIVCGTFIILNNMNTPNSQQNNTTVNISMDNNTNNTTDTQSSQTTTSSSASSKSVAKTSSSGSSDSDDVSSPSTPSSKLDSKDYYTTGVDYYKDSNGNYHYTQYSNGKVVDSGRAYKTSTGQVAKA